MFGKNNYRIICFTSRLLICSLYITLLTPFTSASSRRLGSDNSLLTQKDKTSLTRETKSTKEALNKIPLMFEENRGQFDKRVRYMTRGGGLTTFLTANEIVYLLQSPKSKVQSPKFKVQSSKSEFENKGQRTNDEGQSVALYMRLVGSKSDSSFAGVDEREGRFNYFRGSNPANWQSGVRTFNRVNYESVYEGIDMSFYSNDVGEFEYDFIVKPEAEMNQIAFEIEGALDVRVSESGDLEIQTEAGTVTQRKPFTYQSNSEGIKEEVSSQWSVVSSEEKTAADRGQNTPDSRLQTPDSFTVKFDVGSYDKSKPLIIDPSVNLGNLASSTFLGGTSNDVGLDITVDDSGNVYVTGYTSSVFFPTVPGGFDINIDSNSDVFVTKLNQSASALIYSTFIGGTGTDEGRGIVLDSSGNAYIAGETTSTGFPATVGAFDTTSNGSADAFVTKLNPTGSALSFSTFLGGNVFDEAISLERDSSGNIYVTGRTNGGTFPVTVGAVDTTFNGVSDVFVSKLDSTGATLVYSTYLGGDASDFGESVAVDSSGNAYVTGFTANGTTVDYPSTAGAFQTTHQGGTNDMFVSKINAAGSALSYSTYLGGTDSDAANGITLDSAGNAYIVGTVLNGGGFPVTVGAYDTTHNGAIDTAVCKLNATGSALFFSTFIGGTGSDIGNDIKLDRFGSIYVTGFTINSTTNYPTTAGAFDTTHNGGHDVFMSRLSGDGSTLLYSTLIGGAGDDDGNAIALDSSGNVCLTGLTNNAATNFPVSTTAYQSINGGVQDVFVTKLGDYAIAGRAIDANGAPIEGAEISLSGNLSDVKMTDSQGYFAFTDTESFESYTVAASRNGTTFNPSLFNISNLNRSKQMVFIGTAGAPTGHPAGMFRVFPVENVNESDGFITIAIERIEVFNENVVSVDYRTSEGSALNNEDFVPQQGTLTFLPFEMIKTVDVRITDDKFQENDETFTLTLSNPTGGAGLSENVISQITIADNDAKPRRPKPRVIIP